MCPFRGSGLHIGVLPELASLLWARWEQVLSLELATGQSIPWVFHWNDRGTFKEIHPKALYRRWKAACRLAGVPTRIPHDFRRMAVRNLERAGVPRSVAMKLTGHKRKAVYRRYAIVCGGGSHGRFEEVGCIRAQHKSVKLQSSHNFGISESKTRNFSGKYGGGGEI